MSYIKDNGATTRHNNKAISFMETAVFPPTVFKNSVLAIVIDKGQICDDNLLSETEKQYASVKHNAAVYRNWFFSRIAAKAAAARLWGLNPLELEIRKTSDGVPELFNLGASATGRLGYISISHCSGASAAMASEEAVGIDLERADRPFHDRLVRWSFSIEEQELALKGGAEGDWPKPLALWCAKEAAGKCWGVGLLNHLNKIRVKKADWLNAAATVYWLGGAEQRQATVRFMKYEDYLVALAAQ